MDDTEYVQGFIERGEAIPAGEYWCLEGITIPGDYASRAAAAGRKPTVDGFYPMADQSGPVLIRSRYGEIMLGSVRVAGLREDDALTLIGPVAVTYCNAGFQITAEPGTTEIRNCTVKEVTQRSAPSRTLVTESEKGCIDE